MAVTKHGGDIAPDQTESAFRGHALGAWPAVISSFCSVTSESRHADCSVPGCTCQCHAA
ncbi:MAG: hypothetical protein M3P27_12315 [Acidobacteriota bacterium]|nr:hypothetical protein [Acidobacteriota bacterium]